ncbi:MAG: alpha/beta fold hydrolase [Candidatus Omnitrophica bacterium]|nr:alpha/beta fold hydrolase [Candidatus Omnitrophota bacterium]
MKKRWLLVLFPIFLGSLGCSLFGGSHSPKGSRFIVPERVKSTDITEGSRELLLRENLLEEYEINPESALKKLIARVLKDPKKQEEPRSLFCCAELACAVAERKTPRWNRRPIIYPETENGRWAMFQKDRFLNYLNENEDILTYYGMATYLSYAYLSFAQQKLGTEIYSPRFRRACDIYNYSLSQTIRYSLKRAPRGSNSTSRLDDLQKSANNSFVLVGFEWTPDDVDDLLMAEDYADDEISLKSRRFGLGVPMIGVRYGEGDDRADFYPDVTTFPITALYIPLENYDLEATENQEKIHLVNPWVQDTLEVGESVIPVETDLSTPLAYMLKEAGFDQNILEGYLGGETDFRPEVYLLQPHQPGRIPIVLVHGLLGSPQSWEVFMNGLMDDPWIRQNFEFWFARYPTGKSFLYNARDLRNALRSIRESLDPSDSDPALDHMVLVGHSMGGVLSTLLTHDSGDYFWNMVWDVPIDQLDLSPENRQRVEELFFFDRLPFVDCVVYLATPHRGSPLASRPVGRIASRLIDLPNQSRAWLKEIGDKNQQHAKIRLDEQSFNSTSDLRPDSPPIRALGQLEKPAGVSFHNYAGNIEPPDREGSDGVVPLESATIDWADTQMVVPAKHTEIHSDPDVIRSVKEVLREQAKKLGQSSGMAVSSRSSMPEMGSEVSSQ